jgi:hypothetical protein
MHMEIVTDDKNQILRAFSERLGAGGYAHISPIWRWRYPTVRDDDRH